MGNLSICIVYENEDKHKIVAGKHAVEHKRTGTMAFLRQ